MTAQNNLPRIAISLAIIALPFFAYLEHKQNDLWTNRLAIPQIQQQINLHTPAHTNGTYLPPTINKSTTYTINQSPLILNNTVTITSQGSLTIEPGVQIYVGEYGQIMNQGHLMMNGTTKQPITLTTNELNQANQNWSGIINDKNSQATLINLIIHNASPGISCIKDSHVTLQNITIDHSNQPIYDETGNCKI